MGTLGDFSRGRNVDSAPIGSTVRAAEAIAPAEVTNGTDARLNRFLVVGASVYDFLAAVKAISAHMVTQVGFSGSLVY